MIMDIHFYLIDTTPIVSFQNQASNPFKTGDVIDLEVPKEFITLDFEDNGYSAMYDRWYPKDLKSRMVEYSEKIKNTFDKTKIKILRERKTISFSYGRKGKITIQYFCEFCK
jgi:hypothetical protein